MSSWLSWFWPSQQDAHVKPSRRLPNGNVLVLSVDGGGLRGVLPATLLERLQAQVPFLEYVEVFAGTSTGAIVALALAANHTPQQIVDMYINISSSVFAHSMFSDLKDFEGLVGSSYVIGQQNLKHHLEQAFGDLTIGELERKIIVPAFDVGHMGDPSVGQPLVSWQPKYLTNFGPLAQPQLRVVDVILRSSAAPTYFPSYQNNIDGGMVANNPAMIALSHVISAHVADLQHVTLLSLGTGLFSQCLQGPILDWGVVQWAPHLLDIMFDGVSEVASHQCDAMLGDASFRRINTRLTSKIDMDDIAAVGVMKRLGEELEIDADVAWLKQALAKK